MLIFASQKSEASRLKSDCPHYSVENSLENLKLAGRGGKMPWGFIKNSALAG